MICALGAILEPSHPLPLRCHSTVSEEEFAKIALSWVGLRGGEGGCDLPGGQWAMMSQPSQLGAHRAESEDNYEQQLYAAAAAGGERVCPLALRGTELLRSSRSPSSGLANVLKGRVLAVYDTPPCPVAGVLAQRQGGASHAGAQRVPLCRQPPPWSPARVKGRPCQAGSHH